MENSWFLHNDTWSVKYGSLLSLFVVDLFFTLMVLFGSFVSLQYRMKIFLERVAEFKGI